MLPHYTATRYLVPLREGGSLPAVLDTDGDGLFVAKFRGAGQGAKALLAELIVGGIAAEAGLPLPELALLDLVEGFGRSEPDPEIQDILKQSLGMNVGMRYLEGAYNFDPLAVGDIDPDLAASVVWLDAFATNIDRTARNPNLLFWENRLWLIDHGAALYFHHNWGSVGELTAQARFPAIRDHVLLPVAGDLREADRRMTALVTPEAIERIVAALPDELLMDAPAGIEPSFPTPERNRAAYRDVLVARVAGDRPFVDEAISAQSNLRSAPDARKEYRR